MSTRTITITENAYEDLKRLKCNSESVSDVILRLSGHNPGRPTGQKLKVRDLIGLLKKTPEEHKTMIKNLKKIRKRN